MKTKRIVCVIPARLASTRFPRKMLASIADRPLLAWVWEAAKNVDLFDDVVFAIDSEQTAQIIESFGGKYFMTSPECKSGTDRLVELCMNEKIKADIWVNWQGDEPFIVPSMISDLLQTIDADGIDMWTLKKLITKSEDIFSPKIAKVVCSANGNALYFSRAPIPCFRDETDPEVLVKEKMYYKHVGIYAYTTQALRKIAGMNASALEDAEKLEQLRLLDYGFLIRLHETDQEVFGIDTPEDLVNAEARVQGMLNKKTNQRISF